MANIEIANFPQIAALANLDLFGDFSGLNFYGAYWQASDVGDETAPTGYRPVAFSSAPSRTAVKGNGIVLDNSMGVQPMIESCRYSMFMAVFQASVSTAMHEFIPNPSIILQTRNIDSEGNETSHVNQYRIRGNGWNLDSYNQAFVLGTFGNHQRGNVADPYFVWSIMAQNGIRIHDLSMFVLTWD